MSAASGVPPGNHIFSCIDGHTCGNPVRLVIGGGPLLRGASMSEKRQDFIARHDWVRRSLMFEPRGHDVMSGAILYPPTREDCDIAILYIEVTGCLPMCGHGTIGSVTFALEQGLVTPREEGVVALDAPAGRVTASYVRNGAHIDSVRLRNVPSYLAMAEVPVAVEGLGELVVDIAYGGNFYAIVEKQKNFPGLEEVSVDWLLCRSPALRRAANEAVQIVHPDDPTIRGVSHVQWTGAPRDPRAHGRNAVFYGERAIDRSPCGTGTSARIAQLAARGRLRGGRRFHPREHHRHLVRRAGRGGSAGRQPCRDRAQRRRLGPHARAQQIFVDTRDPLAEGFQLGQFPATRENRHKTRISI